MLVSLYIKNFILIEEMRVDLSDTFNAFTGETGAGKSLFVDALNFVSGERSSASVVGPKSDKAYVEAAFIINHETSLNILKNLGFDGLDEIQVFSREMQDNGRSISRINGRVVNLKSIKDVLESIIDIHSQHETQYLMHNGHHIHLLDKFINDKIALESYQTAYKKYLDKRVEIEDFEKNQYSSTDIILLKEALEEIHLLNPSIEDYEETDMTLKEMENFESAKSNLNSIEAVLTKDEDVLGSLHGLMDKFQDWDQLNERFKEAYYLLEDVSYEISKKNDALYFSEYEFEHLNQRMAQYTQLIRRYGSLDELLVKQVEMQNIMNNIDHYADILIDLKNELKLIYDDMVDKADKLRSLRQEYAINLEHAVQSQLKDLMLENGVFKVHFDPVDFNQYGQDRVVFMVSMNKGMAVSELSKVASGGELSRLMLGLKVIFSKIQGTETLIFDEIDAGVSGRVAFKIGEKMKAISKNAQVISITHLPAVAACADHHYQISKHEIEDKTITKIELMSQADRIDHLAIMMTGSLDEKSIGAAQETLLKGQSL